MELKDEKGLAKVLKEMLARLKAKKESLDNNKNNKEQKVEE